MQETSAERGRPRGMQHFKDLDASLNEFLIDSKLKLGPYQQLTQVAPEPNKPKFSLSCRSDRPDSCLIQSAQSIFSLETSVGINSVWSVWFFGGRIALRLEAIALRFP